MRTPEQFSQWYSVFARVASMAKASICAEDQVNGLATFKEKYVQPQLQLSIHNLTLNLAGSRKDFFPLVPFLEDANFFGFSNDGNGNYTLDVDSASVVKETVADFGKSCAKHGGAGCWTSCDCRSLAFH